MASERRALATITSRRGGSVSPPLAQGRDLLDLASGGARRSPTRPRRRRFGYAQSSGFQKAGTDRADSSIASGSGRSLHPSDLRARRDNNQRGTTLTLSLEG